MSDRARGRERETEHRERNSSLVTGKRNKEKYVTGKTYREGEIREDSERQAENGVRW